MVITLSGVTGSGKSYYKKMLQEKLNLDNQIIYTTRPMRKGEVNGIDKFFVTDDEFDKLEASKKIIVTFEYLGYRYGYEACKIKANTCSIIELHYKIIYKLKQETNQVFSIYIIPKDIETAKNNLKARNLEKRQEELRLKEIDEQAKEFAQNTELQKQLDYIFYNNYDEASTKELINVLKKLNIN